jgi:transposase
LWSRGATALLLVWDNAAWHVSKAVRTWPRDHNRAVKHAGAGVRIVACRLPVRSPWLNPIEPKWGHGKRRAVSPDRILTAQETAERACAALECAYEPHLALPSHVP